MEDYVHVLDYLPNGPMGARGPRAEPLVYAIGESEFRLFELVAKPKVNIQFGARLYIGQEAAKRTEIDHVKRRIKFDELTATAQTEIEYAIADIVSANEEKYVNFYNKAEGLSLKKHALEELPGLGKKTMLAILDERKKGDFKSFDDIATRVPAVKKPKDYIVKRIILELSDSERKHYLFVPKDVPKESGEKKRYPQTPRDGAPRDGGIRRRP